MPDKPPDSVQIQRRTDGRYQVVVNGYIKIVHWDEEKCRDWAGAYVTNRGLRLVPVKAPATKDTDGSYS